MTWPRTARPGPARSASRSRGFRAGTSGRTLCVLADRVGFEPTVRVNAHTLSKRAP